MKIARPPSFNRESKAVFICLVDVFEGAENQHFPLRAIVDQLFQVSLVKENKGREEITLTCNQFAKNSMKVLRMVRLNTLVAGKEWERRKSYLPQYSGYSGFSM